MGEPTGPGRLLAVGDIHGCLEQLKGLLERVGPTHEDQLVFLGDYIDRGPDGRGVVEYLIELRKALPRSVFLKGNHEAMFLDFLADRDRLSFLINGGDTTLQSYKTDQGIRIPNEHTAFLAERPLYFETERFIFVHAGLRPGLPLEKQQEKDLLWIRGEFINSDYDWGKTIVFGHTPLKQPLVEKNKLGLDTGAAYGRTLTCCDVETRRFWQFP